MSLKYPAGYVAIDKILENSGVSELSCQMVIRYIDPAWKRYGYPHLTGDLRINYNHGICEGTSIHQEDIEVFVRRLSRYMQSTTNKGNVQPKANFIADISEHNTVSSYIQIPQQETPIVVVGNNTVNKNRGCGCGRRR